MIYPKVTGDVLVVRGRLTNLLGYPPHYVTLGKGTSV